MTSLSETQFLPNETRTVAYTTAKPRIAFIDGKWKVTNHSRFNAYRDTKLAFNYSEAVFWCQEQNKISYLQSLTKEQLVAELLDYTNNGDHP